MASINSGLWVEKYRPKSVAHLVLPNDFKKFFRKVLADEEIPNLLLHSPTAGTGKTSIAKAIVNDLEADYIYINASSENSIDTLRNQIAGFATTMSFTGKKKIVILDEADGLTPQFQKALRAYMEEFSANCRFILTCNFLEKIIEPLRQGRTMVFDFDMAKYRDELFPQVVARIEGILKMEKIEFNHEGILKIVDKTYPSIRKAISFVQQYAETHGVVDENAVPKDHGLDLAKFLLEAKPNVTAARAFIENEGLSYTDVFHGLFRHFVPACAAPAQATITLAAYESQAGTSADPTLQIAACLYEMCKFVKREK